MKDSTKNLLQEIDEYIEDNPISLLDKIINYSTEDLTKRLRRKNQEYAEINHVYHNFIEGAKICGCLEMQFLWSLMAKHLVSVKDFVDQGLTDKDVIAEKCGDIRAYITLLECYYVFND